MRSAAVKITSICLFLLGGCVEQKLSVTSEPDGALVYLNNEEVGRTPLEHDFVWYGNYDVQLRKDGYETLKTHKEMIAPWWQWVPFDLFAELLPMRLTDQQAMHFTMKPASEQAADPAVMLARANEMRGKLQSSEYTRQPTSMPTSAPATQPTSIPATKKSRHAP